MRDINHHQDQALWTKPFIMMTLCYFLLFLCLQMLLSPLPGYAKEWFHPGDLEVSLVTSLFALSAIASRFLTAILMGIVHRSILLTCGILIAAAATVAYSFADSFHILLLLRVSFGVGFGIGSTIMPTLVSQIIPPGRIGEGIGYFGLSTNLAMSFGPLIGFSVLDSYGFQPLTILAAFAAILVFPLLFGTRSIPGQFHKPAEAVRPAGKTSSAGLVLPALLNTLLSITYGGLLSFLALFGKEVHVNHIGLFFLFNVFTILIVRPVSGRLFDQRGHAAVLIPGSLFIAAGLTVLSYSTTLPMLLVSALLYGFGYGAIQPALQAWMLRDSAPERHGTANSLFYNAIDLGIAAGSVVLGMIASASGYAVMYRYSASVMILFLLVYGIVPFIQAKTHLQTDIEW